MAVAVGAVGAGAVRDGDAAAGQQVQLGIAGADYVDAEHIVSEDAVLLEPRDG